MFDWTAFLLSDEGLARHHIEGLRWPHGPVCPHCGEVDKAWIVGGKGSRAGLYKCGRYGCRKQFTVTVGTILERTRVPLSKWAALAVIEVQRHRKPTLQDLTVELQLSYRTVWTMRQLFAQTRRSQYGEQSINVEEALQLLVSPKTAVSKQRESEKTVEEDHSGDRTP